MESGLAINIQENKMSNIINTDRFTGFADQYDRYRPQPPVDLTAMLAQLVGQTMPERVIDLGCGTGLSTRLWLGHTREVIGIEPSADMRRMAEAQTMSGAADTRIAYREGHGAQTGLPDGCADIVCCVQSFHWMEPASTLAEVERILHPGGVFATVDCDWPPTFNWQVEQAYFALMKRVKELERQLGGTAQQWPKDKHLENIINSNRFRYAREVMLHQVEPGSAERLAGVPLSLGSVQDLLKRGVSEEEIGLPAFRRVAVDTLGDHTIPWYFTYRVRIGVK